MFCSISGVTAVTYTSLILCRTPVALTERNFRNTDGTSSVT